MENINKLTTSELGVTLVQQTEGLTFPKPLTTTDDIAVEIKVQGSRKTYAGFVSLTEVLTDLIQAVKGPQQGEDISEAIDSLNEVYNFLTEYKNTQVLEEIEDASEQDIQRLFPEEDSENSEDSEDLKNNY